MKSTTPVLTVRDGQGLGSDEELVTRLTMAMIHAQLDCDCRPRLDEALERFAALEHKRAMRRYLSGARDQKQRLEAIVPFLQDLEGLTTTEPDRSAYMDLALL